MARDIPTRWKRLLAGLVAIAVTVVLVELGGFDPDAARAVLVRSSADAWFALLPFALLLVVDATAWAIALDVSMGPAMLGRLVQARLGIEAVSLTVPGSILVSDGIAPVIFGRSASIPIAPALAGVAVKKWGIILGHVMVLALAGLVGGGYFERVDAQDSLGFSPRSAIAIACLVGIVSAVWIAALLSSGAAERIRSTLGRVPIGWLHRWTERAIEGAARTDSHARRFFAGPRRRVWSLVVVSSLVWIAESVEVYVLFRILGAHPSFAHVLAMQSLLTIVRSIAVFSPGGLGAQEFAYLSLIPPLLGPDGAGVASGFVVLRRLRDVATIALGYGSLATRITRS